MVGHQISDLKCATVSRQVTMSKLCLTAVGQVRARERADGSKRSIFRYSVVGMPAALRVERLASSSTYPNDWRNSIGWPVSIKLPLLINEHVKIKSYFESNQCLEHPRKEASSLVNGIFCPPYVNHYVKGLNLYVA